MESAVSAGSGDGFGAGGELGSRGRVERGARSGCGYVAVSDARRQYRQLGVEWISQRAGDSAFSATTGLESLAANCPSIGRLGNYVLGEYLVHGIPKHPDTTASG